MSVYLATFIRPSGHIYMASVDGKFLFYEDRIAYYNNGVGTAL